MEQQRMVIRHEWANGARVAADPEAVARQMERQVKRDGAIELHTLIAESAPEDAPLHQDFEWDNDTAGELYRLNQAGHFVAQLRRVVVDLRSEEEQPPERIYIPVSTLARDGDTPRVAHTYIPVTLAQTDADQGERVRADAIRRLDRLAQQFRSVSHLTDLAGDLSDLLMKYR